MYEALAYFGVSSTEPALIESLHTVTKGHLDKRFPFDVQRGVRQSCVL